jgi:ribosome-associated protein
MAQIADDYKADDIIVLDVRGRLYLTDYFVLASGTNPRQLRAIAEEILRETKLARIRLLGAEGLPVSRWVLLDYGDVIVHLFEPTTRAFYDLEMLWGDSPRVVWRRFKRASLPNLAGVPADRLAATGPHDV